MGIREYSIDPILCIDSRSRMHNAILQWLEHTSFSHWWIESGCASNRLVSSINFQTIYRKYKLLYVKWYVRTPQAYRVNSTKYQRQRSSLNCKRNKTLRDEFFFIFKYTELFARGTRHTHTYTYKCEQMESCKERLKNFKGSYRKKKAKRVVRLKLRKQIHNNNRKKG